MILDPKQIDFSKYKRFFTFGCSFTKYIWPTWSNILKEEMPNVEYYNIGTSGAGNMMISNRIVETNLKFKFNESDLVIVMWSTFCREDRWITDRRWVHPGNIYTQSEYNKEFVKKYSDTTGYLIKDMALITLGVNYLNNISCDTVSLMSVPIDHQQLTDCHVVNSVRTAYDPIINAMPESLYTLEMNGQWENGHIYYYSFEKDPNKLFEDYHPNPNRYCQYLLKIGFNLNQSTIDYADNFTKILKSSTVDPKIRSEMNHGHLYKFANLF
jgi:hypothetical protein